MLKSGRGSVPVDEWRTPKTKLPQNKQALGRIWPFIDYVLHQQKGTPNDNQS